LCFLPVFYWFWQSAVCPLLPRQGGAGAVTSAIQGTWDAAKGEVKNVVNNVVFPVLDLILAVLFFVKLAGSYFDYRKHGQFEWAAPAILFACLLFALTAPNYVWTIIGI
jgi:hypothetical protein